LVRAEPDTSVHVVAGKADERGITEEEPEALGRRGNTDSSKVNA
jgi:hypothetical protein